MDKGLSDYVRDTDLTVSLEYSSEINCGVMKITSKLTEDSIIISRQNLFGAFNALTQIEINAEYKKTQLTK